jgi:purine-nucleoside phosphorylase
VFELLTLPFKLTSMLFEQIEEARAAVQTKIGNLSPKIGIILGTGLGGLIDEVTNPIEVPYHTVPHMTHSTVQSHKGSFIFGSLGGQAVMVMAGRLHYYEGWSMQQITFPVRIMKALGLHTIIITNASGGLNASMRAGDIVVVRDHINLLPEHPLRGTNDERLGVRFPDFTEVYHKELRRLALASAREHAIRAQEGVYSVLQGPNLETPAEYEMLHRLGSDCTGMSSVPEAIVARHSEMSVLMLSIIANMSYPLSVIKETTVDDVIRTASEAEKRMRVVIKDVIQKWRNQ